MKRTLSMVLVLAMIFSAMLGVMSFAEAETPEAPKELVVSAANLEFNTAVYLYIAVDYSQLGSAAGVSLKITNNKTGEVVVLNPATDITAPANCVAFKYDTIGAKNMGDELTLQALKDGEACGKSKVYSILEYALKAQGEGDEKLSNLMVAMLAYGANAQKVMKHEGSYDLSKTWGFISVVGSNEGKVIAEAGQPAPFTPNTAKTGANAALYDLATLKKFDGEFVVPAGSHKLIYLGDAQITALNLGMDTVVFDEHIHEYKHVDTAASYNKNFYTTKTNSGTLTKPAGTDGVDYASFYMQMYKVDSTNTGNAVISIKDSTAGGYIRFGSEGKQSYVWWANSNAKKIVNSAAASANNTVTIAITLGKDGTSQMAPGVLRIRAGARADDAHLFKITNDTTKNTSTIIASVNKPTSQNINLFTIQGEEGKQVFATFYMVINFTTQEVSYYTADGSLVTTLVSGNLNKAMANTGNGLFDWTQAGSLNTITLLKNMKVFAGNIFE